MPRELNDIVEGYNHKIKRENNNIMYAAKIQRKVAYITLISSPKFKDNSITEERFNRQVFPLGEITEEKEAEDDQKKRIARMQEFVRQHNLKLSEERRKKALNK